jgi:hypothetical protein
MKTQESISLNLAATLLVGLLGSLLIFFGLRHSSPPAAGLSLTLALCLMLLAGLAALFQYSFVLKPWHKVLADLVSGALKNPGRLLISCGLPTFRPQIRDFSALPTT